MPGASRKRHKSENTFLELVKTSLDQLRDELLVVKASVHMLLPIPPPPATSSDFQTTYTEIMANGVWTPMPNACVISRNDLLRYRHIDCEESVEKHAIVAAIAEKIVPSHRGLTSAKACGPHPGRSKAAAIGMDPTTTVGSNITSYRDDTDPTTSSLANINWQPLNLQTIPIFEFGQADVKPENTNGLSSHDADANNYRSDSFDRDEAASTYPIGSPVTYVGESVWGLEPGMEGIVTGYNHIDNREELLVLFPCLPSTAICSNCFSLRTACIRTHSGQTLDKIESYGLLTSLQNEYWIRLAASSDFQSLSASDSRVRCDRDLIPAGALEAFSASVLTFMKKYMPEGDNLPITSSIRNEFHQALETTGIMQNDLIPALDEIESLAQSKNGEPIDMETLNHMFFAIMGRISKRIAEHSK